MNARQFEDCLTHLHACSEARDWARGQTLRQAWRACERGDWMLWLAGRTLPREVAVIVACEVAECLTLPYVPDGVTAPAGALRAAREWCTGRATLEQVQAAITYAAAAADAADAAAYAAAYTATYAAAAAAAYAAYTAADAASYSADAAAYAAYTAADATAARHDSLWAAAEIVRAWVDVEDIERALGQTPYL